MEENIVIFYENKIDLTNIRKSLNIFEENLIFINIKDLKERKGTLITFFENELLSIPILYDLFQKNKFLRKLVYRFIYSPFNGDNQISYQTIKKVKKIEFKQLTEYINAEIYEKADTLSVKLFNEVREKTFVKKRFVFNDMNLYETNRLEFVEHYYHIFLNLLSIIRLIEIEKPLKIISLPSVKLDKFLIIESVSKQKNIELKQIIRIDSINKLFLQYLKRKIRNIIDYFWYWKIWNLFNRDIINLKRFKIEKKKNLVFSHYKNHFPSLIQVLKQTKKNKNILNIIYVPHKHLQEFKEIIRNENLRNIDIIPHFDIKYKAYLRKYNILKQLLIEIINPDSLNNLIFESIDISKSIRLSFLKLFEKLTTSLRYLENFAYVMTQVKPDLITLLSGNDSIDVLETRLAKKLQIPSLFFPHALISIRRDYFALEQDFIVCAGERDKNYYLELGTDKEKIHVLGIPLFDKLYKKFQSIQNFDIIRESVVKNFNLDSSKKIILLVTTHDEDFIRKKVFNSVIKLSLKLNDCQIIVKIHPVEEVSFYQQLLNEYKIPDILIKKDYNLHDIIIASDLIIGRSSGAQIEALLLGKNVIDLSYESTFGRYLMEKFNAVLPVYDPNDLLNTVQKVLFNDDVSQSLKSGRNEFNEYNLIKFDGQASIRVFQLINKILKRKL